jgi:hypothetical protein
MIGYSTPRRPTPLLHFYDANHLYLMKIALVKTKSPKPNYHQVINNSQQQEEDRETGTAERDKELK